MTERSPATTLTLLAGALLAAPLAGVAQDVEMLGREYGTRPPPEYYETRARFQDAFSFERGWKARLDRRGGDGVEPAGDLRGLSAQRRQSVIAATLGPREGTVEGEIAFPVVLGRFADTDSVAYDSARVQTEFFDGPNSRFRTIPEYYAEVSGGRVQLEGVTHDWAEADLTRTEVAGGSSGLGGNARVGEYIMQLLVELDARGVDWGRFDNDGPDGIPNSGDDDGFVDVLAVIHPTRGGECGGSGRDDRVWSHRWRLRWAAGQEYVTGTPSNSAENPSGRIKVDDYTIQPLLSCDGSSINEIGVMAHELGHGFGLPDLYCTASGCGHTGAGNWGLMGTGSWGCQGGNPARPCHLTAWSKAVLGWVEPTHLETGRDHGTLTLPPVETTAAVHRIDAGDGSGEYFLLENRQPQPDGFDDRLYAPGLLVWHVDPEVLARRWPENSINNDPDHLGVWLRQADGLDELAAGGAGRGDAGDPFPGSGGQVEFHASSTPASVTHDGGAAGVTLLDIAQEAGGEITYRAVTRYQEVRLRVESGQEATEPILTVDGVDRGGPEHVVRSAPYETHVFEAPRGQEVAVGVRLGFQRWADGAPRVREFTTELRDTSLVAVYEGRQLRFGVDLLTPVDGVTPGDVALDPGTEDGWVPEGATVTATAEPRTGFGFVEWGGELEGRPNPATLEVSAPVRATASFEKIFEAATQGVLDIRAAVSHEIVLEAVHANEPVEWQLVEGSLPPGMEFDPGGTITGAALERGVYPLTLHVRDGIGLEAVAELALEVRDPGFSAEILTGPFLIQDVVPDQHQRAYLDRNGNRNGHYDLGDLRAYVLENPGLAADGRLPPEVRLLVPAVDLREAGSVDGDPPPDGVREGGGR